MKRAVYVRAEDRPGLLRDLSDAITSLGGNIEFSIARKRENEGHFLFIFEVEDEKSNEEIERIISELKEVKEVTVEEFPSSEVFSDYLKEHKTIAGEISKYVHPSDFLDALTRMDEESRREVYHHIPQSYMANLLHISPKEIVEEASSEIGPRTLSRVLGRMDPDEVADVVQKLPSEIAKEVYKHMEKESLEKVRGLLRYPPDSAGGIMTSSFPALREDVKVRDALRTLSLGKFEVSDVLFVVDEKGKLLGYLKVLDLLREDPESNLGRICKKDLVTVNPDEDREEVAKLMVKYDISRLPVVDEEGRLLGVVTIEDVADVIVAEHGEDYLLLGGLPKMEDYRYLTARATSLFRKRFLWLLAIYLVESLTARIIKGFGVMISETAIIAAFIPLILATGGNVGSQASTLVVRALALGEVTPKDYLRIVLKELSTIILISPAIASVGFVFAYTISLDLRISLIVSLALGLVTITADVTGALLPLLATILKVDPATISSPLIATISDVSGLVVYLTLASLLLGVV